MTISWIFMKSIVLDIKLFKYIRSRRLYIQTITILNIHGKYYSNFDSIINNLQINGHLLLYSNNSWIGNYSTVITIYLTWELFNFFFYQNVAVMNKKYTKLLLLFLKDLNWNDMFRIFVDFKSTMYFEITK